MADITMNMDDQMLTCLEVMVRGEDMLALGAWEAPIKRLVMKEYARKIGNGYRITDKGRAYFAKSEGTTVEEIATLEPYRPDWVITPLPEGGLVILRKNDLVVSGYEALSPRWVPIEHNKMNDLHTVAIQDNVDSFLQTMLDAAWAKGLRPTVESGNAV